MAGAGGGNRRVDAGHSAVPINRAVRDQCHRRHEPRLDSADPDGNAMVLALQPARGRKPGALRPEGGGPLVRTFTPGYMEAGNNPGALAVADHGQYYGVGWRLERPHPVRVFRLRRSSVPRSEERRVG